MVDVTGIDVLAGPHLRSSVLLVAAAGLDCFDLQQCGHNSPRTSLIMQQITIAGATGLRSLAAVNVSLVQWETLNHGGFELGGVVAWAPHNRLETCPDGTEAFFLQGGLVELG